MKRTWTIVGVADVPQSFKWYQSLLGLTETAPAHLLQANRRLGWNGLALSPRVGCPRASLVDKSPLSP